MNDTQPIIVNETFFRWAKKIEEDAPGRMGLLRLIEVFEAGFYAGRTAAIERQNTTRGIEEGG
jgi:hypothetical protein